jgi:hypothetical protein
MLGKLFGMRRYRYRLGNPNPSLRHELTLFGQLAQRPFALCHDIACHSHLQFEF